MTVIKFRNEYRPEIYVWHYWENQPNTDDLTSLVELNASRHLKEKECLNEICS